MTVAVVVCTRNRPSLLRKCLSAVAELNPAPDQVLVVDNTVGDRETELAALEFSACYIIEPIQGLSRARNRALVESDSDIIAFLDDDAVPNEDWLGHLIEPFTDPNVACTTGETLAPGFASDGAPTRTLSNQDPQWFEIATFGGLGYGTNMALRRTACSDWKGFDVRLGRGAPLRIAEESHAFASFLDRGFRASHVPAAIVVHPLKPIDVAQEATNSIAYWLLLFFEFPGHRLDLVRFLLRRLRREPLTWPRNPQKAGAIITSGWGVRLKAATLGIWIYFRASKSRGK